MQILRPVPNPEDHAPLGLGDRHQSLLEAGRADGWLEGELPVLMPSVDRPELPWIDGRSWSQRVLGF